MADDAARAVADEEAEDEGVDLFETLDAFDGLEVAPVCLEAPWVVAMDRCRQAPAAGKAKFMGVLAELGGHRFHGDEMREAGVIDFAIETVKSLDLHDLRDRPLLLLSCRTIRKVICPNRLNRRRVREAGGLPVLIPVLDCGSEPIVLECAHAIKNTCYGNGVARNEVRELGGVHALTRVLLNPAYENATWRAAVALCGLSWANPANRDIIATTPGVMEAIKLRLGRKNACRTAVGLKALRRHIAKRAAGADPSGAGGAATLSRAEADALAALERAEEGEGEEGEEGEGEDEDDEADAGDEL